MNLAMIVGLGIMLLIILVQWVLIFRVLKALKNRFPEEWSRLGKPTLIMNNSIQNNLALYSFLWRKKYLTQNDAAFTKECFQLRSFSLFGLGVALIWVTTVLVFILIHRQHF